MVSSLTLTLLQISILALTSTSFHLSSLNTASHISLTRRRSKLISCTSNILSSAKSDTNDHDDLRREEVMLHPKDDYTGIDPTALDEGLGDFNPDKKLPGRGRQVLVGDPQKKVEKEYSVSSILKELSAIQEQGPQKYCVLGTRHCSYLHQRIIELL